MSEATPSGAVGASGAAQGAGDAAATASELRQLRREMEALRAEVTDLRQQRRFAELEVERLNVVEPDGTVRLTVSNKARFPAPVVAGRQEQRSGRPQAGVIFYNDDGDECGGLYGYGHTAADGTWTAGGGLNLDQYRPQEQVVGLNYHGRDGHNTSGFRVWERVHGAQVQFPDQESIDASMIGRPYATRVFAGRTSAGAAVVRLADAQGRLRLRLAVSPAGDPSIELLDADGTVTWRVPAEP